jgi:hypothetical protein
MTLKIRGGSKKKKKKIRMKERLKANNMISFDWLEPLSKYATLGAFIFTGITFGITFWRTRKSEQVRIASDISKDLTEIENMILKVPGDFAHQDIRRRRHIQYLNVWEWFSLLVNHREITNETILDHFKPNLIRDHDAIFKEYRDLKDDDNKFPQFKTLYRKWKNP